MNIVFFSSQLCNATCSSLASIEDRLQENLTRLKARYEWLNSDRYIHNIDNCEKSFIYYYFFSQSTFGVIYEKKIVILADSCTDNTMQLQSFLDVLESTIKEQVVSKDMLNLIVCTEGMEKWRDGLSECTQENIMDAIHWVKQAEAQKTPFKTNVIEGLIGALAHSDAEAIYALAHREDTLRVYDTFLEKVTISICFIVRYNDFFPLGLAFFDTSSHCGS